MEEQRNLLTSSLQAIVSDVQQLLWNRDIWTAVRPIVLEQEDGESGGVFLRWLADLYSSSQAIRVRRQTDLHPKSVSMANFLKNLDQSHEAVTREAHVDAYRNSSIGRDLGTDVAAQIARDEFDSLAGTGHNFDPNIARADYESLEKLTKTLRRYVNKSVAHPDRRGTNEIPTFVDLDESIDLLKDLAEKYLLLLTYKGGSIQVTAQMNWMKMFHQPWVPKPSG